MTKVTSVKRLLILASVAVLTMGAAACTREKPTNETPAPQVAASDLSPTPETPGAATTIIPTTPSPTDTPMVMPTVIITATIAPAPTSTPTPAAPPTAPGTYTVQWGDTLNKIAQKSGATTQAIVAANPGLNPNYIVPGQVLVIPAPGGAGTPVPTTGPVQPAACTPTYTVQRGDWFYAIARRFGVSVPALIQANPSANSNVVYPGQVLNIPCGGTSPAPPGGVPAPGGNSYVVRPGDTLFSIAVRFGTTVYAIQIANNLPNPHFIYVGQVLSIPR